MDESRLLGGWMGAAIGDAMGGPVEAQHFKSIVKKVGYVDRLLSYSREWGMIDLQPGYALHEEPGSVTDDTYIRADIARYFLSQVQPWTAENLCTFLSRNADFSYWWKPAVEALERVKDGMAPKKSGEVHRQGGGNGWWYPVAMIFPGDPPQAARVVRDLSQPWKSGLESDLLGALVGAMSYALSDGADYHGVIKTVLEVCQGSLSRNLIQRAVKVAESSRTWQDLCENAYEKLLIHDEPSRDINANLPPEAPGIDFSDEVYSSIYFAEQIPLMIAGFTFGRGEAESICATVTLGRDCDSTATAVGFLVGALHGIDALPKEWVEGVQQSNLRELDLMAMGRRVSQINVQK